MWLSVFVLCLAVVFGDDSGKVESADTVEANFALGKDLVIKLLSNKNAFKKQENSLYDAFCIKDVLKCELKETHNENRKDTYRYDVVILGGLGNEESIGKCQDPNVYIRSLHVVLSLTAPMDNLKLSTSSFLLNDVHITEQETISIILWLQSKPEHVYRLNQEGKLKIDKVSPEDFTKVLARHFPNAPWILKPTTSQSLEPLLPFNPIPEQILSQALQGDTSNVLANALILTHIKKTIESNAEILRINDVLLNINEERLRRDILSMHVENSLSRRDDPLRRGQNSKGKTIAKSSAK